MIHILRGSNFTGLYKNGELVFVHDKHYSKSDFEQKLSEYLENPDEEIHEVSYPEATYYDQFPDEWYMPEQKPAVSEENVDPGPAKPRKEKSEAKPKK